MEILILQNKVKGNRNDFWVQVEFFLKKIKYFLMKEKI